MGFKKGQSGNPNGRPKDGTSWAAVLDKLCNEEIKIGEITMTKREAICRKLLKLASEGERWAIEALMDRIDGKPKQQIEQHNENTGTTIVIHRDDAKL
jgi:hypothetical protein